MIKISIVKFIPNIITLSNLASGFYSIKLTFREDYDLAVTFIIISMFLDFLDGKVARKLDAVSEFGKELDSLSDIVSFGVAPAIFIWSIFPFNPDWLGISLIFFLICGAYRLARFNLKNKGANHFSGFPITTAGGLLALAGLYYYLFTPLFFFALIVVLSVSMVTNIPFFSLDSIPNFKTIFILSFLCIFSFFLPFIIAIILSVYYLSGLILYLKHYLRIWQTNKPFLK